MKSAVVSDKVLRVPVSESTKSLISKRNSFLKYTKQFKTTDNVKLLKNMNLLIKRKVQNESRLHLNKEIKDKGAWNALKKHIPTKNTNQESTVLSDSQLNELNVFFYKMGTSYDSAKKIFRNLISSNMKCHLNLLTN